VVNLRAKFEVSSFKSSRRGSKILKVGHVTPPQPSDLILFFLLESFVVNLHAKFEVQLQRVPRYRGAQNSKNSHMTPSRPILT